MLRELDAKNWELYDLSKDPTETTDLAASNRPKLIEMIALWYTEAGKYNVFPLDSRGTMRFADERPELTKARQSYVYYPGTQIIPENVAAKLLNKSHSLTAEVEIPKGGAEGVLICHGGNVGGYTLFVKDKKLHYVHNYVGAEEFHVVSNADVPEGKVSLAYEFEKTGEPDFKTGKGAAGKAQLYINKKLVGETTLPYTVPLALGIGSGVFIGRNSGSPVSAALRAAVRVHRHDPSGDGGRFRQADRGHGGGKARASRSSRWRGSSGGPVRRGDDWRGEAMKQPRKSSTERRPKGGGDAPVTVMLSDTLPQPPRKFHGRIRIATTQNSQADVPAMPSATGGCPERVLILLDDIGFGHTSAFGGPVNTPTLQRLANEGLRYNRFHTTAFALPRARLC